MNKLLLTTCIVAMFEIANAQTNTFPNSGNAGIGTLSPAAKLQVYHDYGYNTSGDIVLLGGKGLWNLNDWEGMRLGFTQLRSIYEGNSLWGLGVRTGNSDGIGNEVIRIGGNGNVGIGTITPLAKFHNYGQSIFGTNRTGTGSMSSVINIGQDEFINFAFSNTYPNGDYHKIGKWFSDDMYALQYISLGADHGYDKAHWFKTSAENNALIITSVGNIGIGTPSPAERLSVNGRIRAKEVKVETINWPDYVFEEGYELQKLEGLERFIKINKHLPELPTAAEVEKEGISLGEMNAKLLKKIEELTLYMIEQNREMKELKSKVTLLESKPE